MVAWLQVITKLVCSCQSGQMEVLASEHQEQTEQYLENTGFVYEIGSRYREQWFPLLATKEVFKLQRSVLHPYRHFAYYRMMVDQHTGPATSKVKRRLDSIYTSGLRVGSDGFPVPLSPDRVRLNLQGDARNKFSEQQIIDRAKALTESNNFNSGPEFPQPVGMYSFGLWSAQPTEYDAISGITLPPQQGLLPPSYYSDIKKGSQVYLVNPVIVGPKSCDTQGSPDARFMVQAAFQLVFFQKGCEPGLPGVSADLKSYSPPLFCAPSRGECDARYRDFKLSTSFKPGQRPNAQAQAKSRPWVNAPGHGWPTSQQPPMPGMQPNDYQELVAKREKMLESVTSLKPLDPNRPLVIKSPQAPSTVQKSAENVQQRKVLVALGSTQAQQARVMSPSSANPPRLGGAASPGVLTLSDMTPNFKLDGMRKVVGRPPSPAGGSMGAQNAAPHSAGPVPRQKQ